MRRLTPRSANADYAVSVPAISFTTHASGAIEGIEVRGVIDLDTAPRLRDLLADAISAGNRHLIIDIENVDFVDASGLGVLVGALREVRRHGGTLDLVCTNDRLLKILRITGLDKTFGLHRSIHAAMVASTLKTVDSGRLDLPPTERAVAC